MYTYRPGLGEISESLCRCGHRRECSQQRPQLRGSPRAVKGRITYAKREFVRTATTKKEGQRRMKNAQAKWKQGVGKQAHNKNMRRACVRAKKKKKQARYFIATAFVARGVAYRGGLSPNIRQALAFCLRGRAHNSSGVDKSARSCRETCISSAPPPMATRPASKAPPIRDDFVSVRGTPPNSDDNYARPKSSRL